MSEVETKCGFCQGKKFEFVPLEEGIKFARLYRCAKCGHPVGIAYDSEILQNAVNRIAKKVESLG
jgi:DNA-directed RNA polymerase subunit RPC12/RpoP